jgi:TPR repeat protein
MEGIDYKQAIYLFLKAAEHGNADAMNYLGMMYEHGLGVPQDYGQAMQWYRKAAWHGNEWAQCNLHRLYDLVGGSP